MSSLGHQARPPNCVASPCGRPILRLLKNVVSHTQVQGSSPTANFRGHPFKPAAVYNVPVAMFACNAPPVPPMPKIVHRSPKPVTPRVAVTPPTSASDSILAFDNEEARFSFLGGCPQAHPPYTPSRILLNRSIARPLVRGESMFIILPRAVIISAIALGVPAFAVSISGRRIEHGPLQRPGNATIFLGDLFGHNPWYPYVSSFNVTTTTWGAEIVDCAIPNEYSSSRGIVVECPRSWLDVLNMTISLSIEQGNGAYMTPLPGSLQESPASTNEYLMASLFFDVGSSGVPLLPGSRLFGVVTWTRRDLIITSTWGFSSRVETIFTPDITGLQPDSRNVSDPSATTLTLFQPSGPTTRRLLRETVDATALSGIATFGGFWTFLNGAFALFFGANVLYFMFGRRPLSALGLVHILQRRRLVRQWQDDFPAIHTEGGPKAARCRMRLCTMHKSRMWLMRLLHKLSI
ncbi:hypothetical protein B0H14DRAFT_3443458 [Mycena olivaceomarginata]|nr:hypothetical protein B0H14DRAFT_3443458 [Mycena olivaceomarginata]